MVLDSLSDMFTKIRNAYSQKHEDVDVFYSKMNFNICQILKDSGFIISYKTISSSLNKKKICIQLKYRTNGNPIISKIERVSKPSKRIYVKKSEVPKVLSGYGVSLISTSKGVLTGKQARLKNVGGEILGVVW